MCHNPLSVHRFAAQLHLVYCNNTALSKKSKAIKKIIDTWLLPLWVSNTVPLHLLYHETPTECYDPQKGILPCRELWGIAIYQCKKE
jgi:hypothetical protein